MCYKGIVFINEKEISIITFFQIVTCNFIKLFQILSVNDIDPTFFRKTGILVLFLLLSVSLI